MPAASNPIALLFGIFDPTGCHDIPGDNVTCAAHAVHGLSVLTGTAHADSTGIFGIDPPSIEHLDEQARCVLEDMPIHAIKIGAIPSPEIASAIAEIVADYSDVPLVLHLPALLGPHPEQDEEEFDPVVGAVLELLLPQATVAVMPAGVLGRWINDDVLQHLEGTSGPPAILKLGVDWVLVTAYRQRPGSLVNLLLGPDGQTLAWPLPALPERTQDISGLVATALAARLAKGETLQEAARLACEYATQAAHQAFQPGMGLRLAARLPKTASPKTAAPKAVAPKTVAPHSHDHEK